MGLSWSPSTTQSHRLKMLTTSPYCVAPEKHLLTYCMYAALAFFTRVLLGLLLGIFYARLTKKS